MPRYRFGDPFDIVEFDTDTGELVRDGRRVRLRPQPARALMHLLMRPGELVSRRELQRAIWPEGTFVHFDDGLNSCLKQIRAALGDSPSAPAFVETLVKRGFRFLAPVSHVSHTPGWVDKPAPTSTLPELRPDGGSDAAQRQALRRT